MMQFDTHKVFKKFKDAGVEDKAADAFVEAINEARASDLEHLATKQDLADVKSEIKVINVKLENLEHNLNRIEENMNKGFDKIYNLGKFILAVILIPVGIKVIEYLLPKFLH